MGRPKRGEARLHLRLSRDEHDMCERVAQALGLKLSEAVRAVMREKYHVLGLGGTRTVLPLHEVVTKTAPPLQCNDTGDGNSDGPSVPDEEPSDIVERLMGHL